MPAPFYQLLGHVFIASHTAKENADARAALKKVGVDKDQIKQGLALAKRGEEIIEQKVRESVVDKTLEHNIHSAMAEVEMWHQTVRFRLRKIGFAGEERAALLGEDLHAHKHTLSVVVQALRTLAQLRVRGDVLEQWGSEQSLHDTIMRGNTLLAKALKVLEIAMTPSSISPDELPVFAAITQHIADMTAWLEQLADVVDSLDASAMGLIGFVPPEAGVPAGGTAVDVIRHERAQRAAPNPRDASATSGWSIGRQGNAENGEKGWILPTYDETAEATERAEA